MNSTLIALIIVTQAGIQTGPKFNSVEECESARANIKNVESFCYQQPEVDVDQAIDQLGDIIRKMKKQLDLMSQSDKKQPSTI
jgi:hypothetical protein